MEVQGNLTTDQVADLVNGLKDSLQSIKHQLGEIGQLKNDITQIAETSARRDQLHRMSVFHAGHPDKDTHTIRRNVGEATNEPCFVCKFLGRVTRSTHYCTECDVYVCLAIHDDMSLCWEVLHLSPELQQAVAAEFLRREDEEEEDHRHKRQRQSDTVVLASYDV